MRLEVNYRKRKSAKSINTWKLNNKLLNNKWVILEIKEIKNVLEINDNENMMTQNLWGSTNEAVGWKFIAIQSYLEETRKASNRQPNLTPRATREEEQRRCKISRKKS